MQRTSRARLLWLAPALLAAVGALLLLLRGGPRGPADWNAKDAYRRCAEPDPPWPADAPQRCRALHMCINEAAFTPAEHARFRDLIAATPDCPPP